MKAQRLAFERMEGAFADTAKPRPVPIDSPQGMILASLIGRWRVEQSDYTTADRFFLKAAGSRAANDCQRIQHATLLPSYPASQADADHVISRYHALHDMLLAAPGHLRVASVDDDPYVFCVMSAFPHSLYLQGSVRDALRKHSALVAKAFPELHGYASPHVRRLNGSHPSDLNLGGRRIRLGVASAFFAGESSVVADFRGVLDRLPRDEFELIFIHLDGERRGPKSGRLYRGRPGSDQAITVSMAAGESGDERGDEGGDEAGNEGGNGDGDGRFSTGSNGIDGDSATAPGGRTAPRWLVEARRKIGGLELDLLLYLDLTMSPLAQRLAMSRLAPVQATSHGHPVTSGLPPSVMQHFISWGAAELPLAQAQEHYTERLALLPANSMHQYYQPRAPGGVSIIDGQSFAQLRRSDFAPLLHEQRRPEGHAQADRWYLCMQKPFKRQPAFDSVLAAISRADPHARLLLHDVEPSQVEAKRHIIQRLELAGADLSRVHFLPVQPHHRLLALYALSDVVLDSLPASGCTTTREALEVGALVVTMPGRYLGSRWTMAYYDMLGVGSDLIASDADDYVRRAVRIATDEKLRAELKARVHEALPRLYHREEAVVEWSKLLRRLALGGGEGGEEGGVTDGDDDPVVRVVQEAGGRATPAMHAGRGGGVYL